MVPAPIVVLGSKSGARYPAVAPTAAFGANNAVELAVLYRERYGSKAVGVAPLVELKRHEHIRASFIKARPDEVMILGTDLEEARSFVRGLGLEAPVRLITPAERNRLLRRQLGWRIIPAAARALTTRGLSYALGTALPDLFGTRQTEWLSPSTGITALLYALFNYPETLVLTAGISLQAGGHFNNEGQYTPKSAKLDRTLMRWWRPERRARLHTTDPIMSEVGHVPLYAGEVFSL